MVPQNLFMLVLFGDFYKKAYMQKRKRKHDDDDNNNNAVAASVDINSNCTEKTMTNGNGISYRGDKVPMPNGATPISWSSPDTPNDCTQTDKQN